MPTYGYFTDCKAFHHTPLPPLYPHFAAVGIGTSRIILNMHAHCAKWGKPLVSTW